MVVRQQQQQQKQQQEEGAQTDSVLRRGVRSAADTLNRVFHQATPHPQLHFREDPQTRVLEDTVPMVALECELALSGRLSPPADPTAMPLPLQSDVASSSGGEKDDPLNFLGHGSGPPPSSVEAGADRPGCKRKLPQSVDDRQHEEDQCAAVVDTQEVFQGTAVVACERCGENRAEEQGSKRRRRSHECSDTASMKVEEEEEEDSLEDTSEQPHSVLVEISHMDLSVEQTLDVITTSGHSTEHDSVLVKIPGGAPETEVVVAPLMGDVVVDSSGTSFVQDSPDKATTQEIPDSVVGADIVVVGGDASKDAALSDPHHLASTTATCQQQQQQSHHQQHQLSDSFCGGGGGSDASSEEGDNDNDAAAFLGEVVCSRPRPQRISPFLNTPKQRKEERRKVLKLSIHKMRAVEDPEHFLRRSVLINNTMKRLQQELREEKMRNSPRKNCYTGLYRRSPPFHYYDDALNHNNSHSSYVLSDESFVALGDPDRITDDMTDALVTRLEAATSSSSHHLAVVPTPSPSPSPLESAEPAATYLKEFDMTCHDESSSSATTCTTTSSLSSSSSSLGACGFSDVISSSTCNVTESTMSVMMNVAEMMTTSPSSSSSFGTELPSSCSGHLSSDDLMMSPMESAAATSSLEVDSVSSSVVCELTSSVSDMTSSSAADVTSSVPELTSVNCVSSSSSFSSSSSSLYSGGTCDNSAFAVPSMVRECPSPTSSSSCSSESQREKQLFTDIDVVFNNLIHALGDS